MKVTNKELVTLLGALIDEVIRVSDNAHVYNDETGERVSLVDAVKILNQLKGESEGMIHYAANKQHGVFQIDPIDYPDRELMSVKDFLESLSALGDGETVFTAATQGGWDYCEIELGYLRGDA